jgi:hypothetical protein
MKNNKYQPVVTGLSKFIVTCETGQVYLALENRYPEKGEVLELTEERANVLLSAGLIAKHEGAQEEEIKKEL